MRPAASCRASRRTSRARTASGSPVSRRRRRAARSRSSLRFVHGRRRPDARLADAGVLPARLRRPHPGERRRAGAAPADPRRRSWAGRRASRPTRRSTAMAAAADAWMQAGAVGFNTRSRLPADRATRDTASSWRWHGSRPRTAGSTRHTAGTHRVRTGGHSSARQCEVGRAGRPAGRTFRTSASTTRWPPCSTSAIRPMSTDGFAPLRGRLHAPRVLPAVRGPGRRTGGGAERAGVGRVPRRAGAAPRRRTRGGARRG